MRIQIDTTEMRFEMQHKNCETRHTVLRKLDLLSNASCQRIKKRCTLYVRGIEISYFWRREFARPRSSARPVILCGDCDSDWPGAVAPAPGPCEFDPRRERSRPRVAGTDFGFRPVV